MSDLDWKPEGRRTRYAGFELKIYDRGPACGEGLGDEYLFGWQVTAIDRGTPRVRGLSSSGYAATLAEAEGRARRVAEALRVLVECNAHDLRWGWPAEHQVDMCDRSDRYGGCMVCGKSDAPCYHSTAELQDAFILLLRAKR
jgi:hypothetical protein